MAAWWPILVLVYVPTLVLVANRIIYARGVRKLDLEIPDELPHTAGEWITLEIERLGLAGQLQVIATDEDARHSTNAYHPYSNVIQLTADTYFKRDPVYWAIAAHELGHARFKMAWPILGNLIMAAVFVRKTLVALGIGIAAGNVLYAVPGATSLAFTCFAAAALLQILTLVDEGVASLLAINLLRASPHLHECHVRASRSALGFAFLTYFLAAVSRALLLTQWFLIERVTAQPRVPPIAELTALGKAGAIVASIVIMLASVWRVMRAIKPIDLKVDLVSLAGVVGLVGFLWLVWNTRADLAFVTCTMLALATVTGLVELVVVLPMSVLHVTIVSRIQRRLDVEEVVKTAELAADRKAGKHHVRSGNVRLDALFKVITADPPLVFRLQAFAQLAYLPLVVIYWLM